MLAGIGARADEVDMTSSLQNPSFENDDINTLTVDETRASTSNTGAYTLTGAPTGWTLTNAPATCDIMTAEAAATDNDFGAPGSPSNGTQMLYLRDSWDDGDLATTLTQKVTLSAGTYKLTVDSKCIHNGSGNVSPAKLVANGEHAELPYHSLFVPANWDETSVTFMLTDETEVEIGVEVTFSNGQAGFSVLLDNFTLTAVDDMELIAHYEEAEYDHWSLSTNGTNIIERNTWSTELDTESGMAVPFMQYWAGSGYNLPDATISHKQLVGLPAGGYIVSVFARAFNENSTDTVSKGITFTANEQSVDLTTGTKGTYNSVSAEVYGVYTLNCTVSSDGKLDIGFTVASETACDWIAWKDLKVVMDTEDYPTLTALTGEMTQRAKTNMETALATYAANPSGDNFLAAIDALQKAQESIEAYANGATIEEDDYLIINVESGYYLAGGLYWGTCAMEGGRPQFVTLETYGSDGAYSLDSHQYNTAANHYLNAVNNDGLYMDGTITGWTIAYDETNGGYTFYNATAGGYLTGAGFQTQVTTETTATSKSYWKLVTKDEIIAQMDTASVNSPVDVSALIPSCEPKRNPWGGYNLNSASVNTGAWTVTGYGTDVVPDNYSLGQSGNAVSCAESWHSTNGFDMRQIVTFPKAGYYILTSQAFHDHTASGITIYPSMYAGDRSVEIYRGSVSSSTGTTDMQNAYQDLLDGLHPLSLCLYVERDNTDLTVGFTSNNASNDVWNVFGELGLQYLGNDSYEGFVVHEEEAVVDDWSIVQNGGNGVLHLNNWSTEADESGMVTPFMEYWCGSSYTLSAATISHTTLTDLYPGMYEVSLDIRVLNENSLKVGEGTLFKANDASEDLVAGKDAHDTSYGSNDDVYGTYDLTCIVGEDGTLNISIVIPDDVTYDWIAFKNLKVTYLGDAPEIEWTLGASYGTLILPFDYDLSADNLKAYTVASITENGDDATLTLSDGITSIAANTPYIIGGSQTGKYSFIGIPTNDKDSYTSEDGYLTGYMVADYAPADSYVLQNQDNGLAFYLVNSSDITVGAYHCYLNYPAATGAKLVVYLPDTDDVATRIDAVETEETAASEAIYDLSGRRVAKAQKGIYIVNGKKMVIK